MPGRDGVGPQRRGWRLRFGMARQVDVKTRAPAGTALAFDPAAMLFDDAENHGEAEPGAFTRLLCREERLVDALANLRRHAVAGIGHAQANVFALPGVEMP